MPTQGPLNDVQAGKLWSNAFINEQDRKELEKDPQTAASNLFGNGPIHPLLNTSDPGSYSAEFYSYLGGQFQPAEQQMIRDHDSDDLLNDVIPNTIDKPKLTHLKNKLKGNVYSFRKKGAGGKIVLLDQKINGPSDPNLPLTQNQWIRVYAHAHLDSVFKQELENNPTQAINSLPASFNLGHNSGAPIFYVPTDHDLWQALDSTHPLKNNFKQLQKELDDIVKKPHVSAYEGRLMVNLTC